jgi:integrase
MTKTKGTIWRVNATTLYARITAKNAEGKTVRPYIPIDPALSDDDAREVARKLSLAAKGKVWSPPQDKTPISTRPTCDEYFERLWIPSRSSKKSLRSDLYRYRLHISPIIGKKHVDEVTTDDLRDLVQWLDEKAQDGEVTFSAKTAQNCWAVASKMFRDLAHSKKRELRLLSRNPAEGVVPPDPPGEVELQWLFPVELQKLLACPEVPRERRALYAVAVYCCCRPGEVLALLWRLGVDVAHGMVRVNRSFDSKAQVFHEYTKTGRSRHFSIEPLLRPMLEAMYRRRSRESVFEIVERPYDVLREDLLTAGVDRPALHKKNRKGVRALRFHDLRATGITYMAMRGDTDNMIRERAGHSDFKTTQIYIRRGHQALGASIGDPFAPLPESLQRFVYESSNASGESAVSPEELLRRGRDSNSPAGGAGSPNAVSGADSEGESRPSVASAGGLDDSLDDPFGARRDNLLRVHRLERLADVDPSLPLRPGLAVARALEKVLAGDVDGAVAEIAEEARRHG